MDLKIYQVDAFTDKVFKGNPAAVCPLGENWLDDKTMQLIARENNLSETAFYTVKNGEYAIRWFTPKKEVKLCGHATLATAFVIFEIEEEGRTEDIKFDSKSGVLTVSKNDDMYTLDFPADKLKKIDSKEILLDCFNISPQDMYQGKSDLLLVYKNQEEIEGLQVDFKLLSNVDTRGVIVTAEGNDVDFVSRFFAPRYGVDEDPVTGSAHTTLVKYWSEKLDKRELVAKQLSERGGKLYCVDHGDRVDISGEAVLYLEGTIDV